MITRKEAVNALVTDLESSTSFKRVYRNIVPIWTKVSSVPAVAVLYSEEEISRDNISSKKVRREGSIVIYIYNKQRASEYEDILTELIEEVEAIVINNEYLQCNTIECVVGGVKVDGGTIHPYSMAQLRVDITFLQKL